MVVSERDIEEQFFMTLKANNIIPREDFSPIMDGKIHRFDIAGHMRGNQAGAYIIHADGCPNWLIKNWYEGGSMKKFTYSFTDDERRDYAQQHQGITPEQREAQRRANEARQAEAAKLQREKEAQAKTRALKEYECATPCGIENHPYIRAKQLSKYICFIFEARIKTKKEIGDFCNVGDLLFPLHDAYTGEFRSLQRITSTPDERGKFSRGFYAEISVKGACYTLTASHRLYYLYTLEEGRRLPPDIEILHICEGVATGLSVIALDNSNARKAVICAMSAGNIINIAQAFRTQYPKMKIIIDADNDDAGIKATERTIAAGYADGKITPQIRGYDWSDVFISERRKNHE